MKWLLPVAVCAVALTFTLGHFGQSGERQWTRATTLVKLQDRRITESSGIAPSQIADGVYYTHNDSGDTARFFKFDRAGRVLGTYNVRGASAVDWEDIASAKIGGKPYLFVGDIGDNAGNRRSITVYRVPEPTHNGEVNVRADRTYTLRYPDEPHNAESLMIHPRTGDFYIVTKANTKPSQVFKLAHPGKSGSYMLAQIGTIDLPDSFRYARLITAGDISPDAKHMMIRTYMAAWEYDVRGSFDDWMKNAPRKIETNFELQGEGICYSRDGKSLLTTSEGVPCQVSEAKLR